MAVWKKLRCFMLVAAMSTAAAVHRVAVADDTFDFKLPCASTVRGQCGRAIVDGFVLPEEVSALHEIADRGMSGASETLGPLIMDINTGYVFGAAGLRNMYTAASGKRISFTSKQYALYRDVVMRVRSAIQAKFEADVLLTAPTFLTRIKGGASWEPSSEHDKYFHYHVDKNNTAHYDYSGLVYLSDVGSPSDVAAGAADFAGGVFDFNDDPTCQRLAPTHADFSEQEQQEFVANDVTDLSALPGSHPSVSNMTYVLPRAGRLVIFSAGQENLHRVARVQAGTRLTLSLWFTLDPKFEFQYFLDGQPHEQVLSAARKRAGQRRQRGRARANTRPKSRKSDAHTEL